MPAAVQVTGAGHRPAELGETVRKRREADHRRRLAATVMVAGTSMSRAEIARQTRRDRVRRHSDGGGAAPATRRRCGRPSRLGADRKDQVREWLEAGAAEGSRPWTVAALRDRIRHAFGVAFRVEAVRRLIRSLSFRHLSPRPAHPALREAFRRDFQSLARDVLPEGAPAEAVDIRFQDESRIGRKGPLTPVWARRGTRPRIPRGHRHGYRYPFAAFRPRRSVAAGHVRDRADTGEMNRHPAAAGEAPPTGRHAPVIPSSLSPLHPPPYSPGPNPMETAFGFLKKRHFANRTFETVREIKGAVEEVRKDFAGQPDRIASLGRRRWATMNPDESSGG